MEEKIQIATSYTPTIFRKLVIEWKLEGYSWIKDKPTGEYIESPILFEGCGINLKLRFYPGGSTVATSNAVFLVFRSLDANILRTSFSICLKGIEDGTDFRPRTTASKMLIKDSLVEVDGVPFPRPGFSPFLPIQDIAKYLKDDCLTFQISLQVWCESAVHAKTSHQTNSTPHADLPCLSELANNFGQLFQTGNHSDVTLKVGEEFIPAHKIVLASRSQVFEQMFFGPGMKESLVGSEVQIDDLELDTVKAFLHSLYTAEIQLACWEDSEALCHLLKAFHKYQVKQLLEKCERQLSALFSIENVCERLMLAELLDLADLRSSALSFITTSTKSLADVQATDGFQRLKDQRPKLVAEILAKVAPPAAPLKRSRQSGDDALPEDLNDLTVLQLKQLLGDRGLSTSGNKAALVERLRASRQM